LLATGAVVIAEATSTDTTTGAGSFLLGGAGLIAAISDFTKDNWTDRQKQCDHEVALLRIKIRNYRAGAALHELYNWAKAARTADSTLPAVLELHLDDNDEPALENHRCAMSGTGERSANPSFGPCSGSA
jgi:hypothetical protein